jgi:hypothetical protein
MDQALLDPASVFETPDEVLAHEGLSRKQKIEILRRSAYDATEISVAVEEGMPSGDNDVLRRILLALEKIAGRVDLEKVGPTKQHGIPRSAVKSK